MTQVEVDRMNTGSGAHVFELDKSPNLKEQEKSFEDIEETHEIETRDISVEGEKSEVKLDGEEEETAESREVVNHRMYKDS